MEEHTMIHENQEDQDEETEEALSLCDLPLMGDDDDNTCGKMEMKSSTASQTRKSSSEPVPEIFEFLSDNSSDMISAEDIIFCGKLIPLKEPNSLPISHDPVVFKRHIPTIRRRCESFSELQFPVSRSNSAKARGLVRNSRSLDYRKLDRFSAFKKTSSESTVERSSSVKSVEKAGDHLMALKKAASKPRWFQLLFGVVKPPTWMELRDIKSRQIRLNPTVGMFPPPMDAGGKKVVVENGSLNKGSCGLLLKVLSCKDPASVAVTTSFCMPQVQSDLVT